MRRWLVKAAAVLAVCLAIAGVAVYAYLRRSLPDIDGQVSVNGLSSSIDIVRDADAIPHIFASTVPDALFGLGYVHAQDRLWQMEFQRRIGHGRLSEIFGPATVPRIASFAPSASGVPRVSPGSRCPNGRRHGSTPMSRA